MYRNVSLVWKGFTLYNILNPFTLYKLLKQFSQFFFLDCLGYLAASAFENSLPICSKSSFIYFAQFGRLFSSHNICISSTNYIKLIKIKSELKIYMATCDISIYSAIVVYRPMYVFLLTYF